MKDQIRAILEDYKLNGIDLEDAVTLINDLKLKGVSKHFDFDKLLQDYRQEFINGGGYVKSDTFESGTEPYEIFEWFKNKLS